MIISIISSVIVDAKCASYEIDMSDIYAVFLALLTFAPKNYLETLRWCGRLASATSLSGIELLVMKTFVMTLLSLAMACLRVHSVRIYNKFKNKTHTLIQCFPTLVTKTSVRIHLHVCALLVGLLTTRTIITAICVVVF